MSCHLNTKQRMRTKLIFIALTFVQCCVLDTHALFTFLFLFFVLFFFPPSLTLDWDSMKQVQLFTQETEAYGRVTQGHTIYIQDFCLWESMIKWLLQIKGISLISSSFLTMTPCVGVILGRTSQVFVLPGGETKHSHSSEIEKKKLSKHLGKALFMPKRQMSTFADVCIFYKILNVSPQTQRLGNQFESPKTKALGYTMAPWAT